MFSGSKVKKINPEAEIYHRKRRMYSYLCTLTYVLLRMYSYVCTLPYVLLRMYSYVCTLTYLMNGYVCMEQTCKLHVKRKTIIARR